MIKRWTKDRQDIINVLYFFDEKTAQNHLRYIYLKCFWTGGPKIRTTVLNDIMADIETILWRY